MPRYWWQSPLLLELLILLSLLLLLLLVLLLVLLLLLVVVVVLLRGRPAIARGRGRASPRVTLQHGAQTPKPSPGLSGENQRPTWREPGALLVLLALRSSPRSGVRRACRGKGALERACL